MISLFWMALGLVGAEAGIAASGIIYSWYNRTNADSVKIRASEDEFEPVTENPRKKHGLIIIGKKGNKHQDESARNTSYLVYKALKSKGFEIYVLNSGSESKDWFDCPVYPSDKQHLADVFYNLYAEVKQEDAFFMYVLADGGKEGKILPVGQSKFYLHDGIVYEDELEKMLSRLNPDHSILYFNSCFSGGFAKRLGKGRNIAISTSRPDKITSGRIEDILMKKYGDFATTFTLFFYSALQNQMPDGDALTLGDISIEDAFDYAAQKEHSNPEARLGNWFRNTPHLVYDKINPKNVRL